MCSRELFLFYFIGMLQGGMGPDRTPTSPPLPSLEITYKETTRRVHDRLPTDFKRARNSLEGRSGGGGLVGSGILSGDSRENPLNVRELRSAVAESEPGALRSGLETRLRCVGLNRRPAPCAVPQ